MGYFVNSHQYGVPLTILSSHSNNLRKEEDTINTQTFMISLKFLPQYRQEIFEILPQERARAEELRAQGIIEAIYLSSDNTVGWLIAHGESQTHVQATLASLPLYIHGYMEATLTPLT